MIDQNALDAFTNTKASAAAGMTQSPMSLGATMTSGGLTGHSQDVGPCSVDVGELVATIATFNHHWGAALEREMARDTRFRNEGAGDSFGGTVGDAFHMNPQLLQLCLLICKGGFDWMGPVFCNYITDPVVRAACQKAMKVGGPACELFCHTY